MAEYKKLYTTDAVNTGGRDGKSYLTDGTMEVVIRTPKEMGGKGEGTNPEQLFALGYSACFHGALEIVKGQEKVKEPSLVKHSVSLYKKENAVDFKLEVAIQVAIEGKSLEETQELADKAHQVCPYSKAVGENIEVNVKAVEYSSLEN